MVLCFFMSAVRGFVPKNLNITKGGNGSKRFILKAFRQSRRELSAAVPEKYPDSYTDLSRHIFKKIAGRSLTRSGTGAIISIVVGVS